MRELVGRGLATALWCFGVALAFLAGGGSVYADVYVNSGDRQSLVQSGKPTVAASVLKEYFITCDPDSFNFIYRRVTEDHYIPITFSHAGKTWSDVRMRIRGDSSRSFPKKSLKIRFDAEAFADGRDVLNFNAEYFDKSYVRAVLSSQIMRQAGQSCFAAEHARLYLNGEFLGLYVDIENMDENFLTTRGFDAQGNLYKAALDGACMSLFDNVDVHWEKKTNSGQGRGDLKVLIGNLNSVSDAEYYDFVRENFDYEKMVNIIALNMLLANGSTYYHNYYMYHDIHDSGKWVMFPWDLDRTLGDYGSYWPYHRSSQPRLPDNPLVERALLSEVIFGDIRARIDELAENLINPSGLFSVLDSLQAVLAVSVAQDVTDNVADTTAWKELIEHEKSFIQMRHAALTRQFDNWPQPFRVENAVSAFQDEVTLSWHPAADLQGDEISYTLKYSKTATFNADQTVVIEGIADTSYTLPVTPEQGQYYWFVAASDGSGAIDSYARRNVFVVGKENAGVQESGQAALPVYAIHMESGDLDNLNTQPGLDIFYPARFEFNGQQYDCEVRFRGSTGRGFPKKSWKVRFSDRDNPFGVKKINLNAEYLDPSAMRNRLAMELFRFMGSPAPTAQHINLFVNDDYIGVYLQIEQVDEQFLERNELKVGTLYKAKNNGANLAPLLDYDAYFTVWEQEIGDAGDYRDLQSLFNQFLYLTYEDFQEVAPALVNINNVLQYFAVIYAISNIDGISKNFYLYLNPETGRLEIFPWDNDASFGNDWSGEYLVELEQFRAHGLLLSHTLFQRLMEYEFWRDLFWQKVRSVAQQGFSFVETRIDSLHGEIGADVLRDPLKKASNAEFAAQILQLKTYLAKRRDYLGGVSFFDKSRLYDFFSSNPFPTSANPEITFRATSTQEQAVELRYILDMSYAQQGVPFTFSDLELFDDGEHDDLQAGDLVYGNRLVLPQDFAGLVPYTFRAFGDFPYSFPENGLHYINFFASKSLAFNANVAQLGEYQRLQIGEVFKSGEDFFVEIINPLFRALDLSYCHLQAGAYFHRFTFPAGTRIGVGETLIATSNRNRAAQLFEGKRVYGNLYFEIARGDTLRLLSPALTPLTDRVTAKEATTINAVVSLVINEINYRSVGDFDTGDWIELYNPNEFAVDLSDWSLTDGNADNVFTIPRQVTIAPRGYWILCQDKDAFGAFHPAIGELSGDWGFGLSSAGEAVQLYDQEAHLVDALDFSDDFPWPTEPDGDGPTLELADPRLDNALPTNWRASKRIGGTPAAPNGTLEGLYYSRAGDVLLFQNEPNPYNASTRISYQLPAPARVRIAVYNIAGQLVEVLVDDLMGEGLHSVNWQPGSIATGVYLYSIWLEGELKAARKALYVR